MDEDIKKQTIEEIEEELDNLYLEKNSFQEDEGIQILNTELEDKKNNIVSQRIEKLLSNEDFELSKEYLFKIHETLFKDITDYAGEKRDENVCKHEIILHGDTAIYGDYHEIDNFLDYDMKMEKIKDYLHMKNEEVIDNISSLTQRLWQAHPFKNGNTRTIVVFIEKYLKSLGYNVNNTLFKEKAIYFRNALVRSNYYDINTNIDMDLTFIKAFYENLLFNYNNELNSRDMIVSKYMNVQKR